jgi:quercetin dioxygenase-like cupin family protein
LSDDRAETAPTPTAKHIPLESAKRVLWGDDRAGETLDWIHITGGNVHQMLWGMPPGGAYRQSGLNPTLVAADMIYHVLHGVLVVSNPSTGEVHRVNKGETIICPRGTWNYGFRYSVEELRVLELTAPAPAKWVGDPIMSTELPVERYVDDDKLGRWPLGMTSDDHSLHVVRGPEIVWRLEGATQQMLVGTIWSTPHLTFGCVELLPGRRSDIHTHGGDEIMYLVEGGLIVRAEDESDAWFELKPGDAFYVPEGVGHSYYNFTDEPATATFLAAPQYLPRGAAEPDEAAGNAPVA